MVDLQSRFCKFSLALSVKMTLLAVGFTLAQMPSVVLAQGIPQTWEAKEYRPPSGIGSPRRTEPGGTRGPTQGCPIDGNALRALVPNTRFGVTVAGYPTFFVYMPAPLSRSSTLPVEFLLEDSQGKEIYKSTFDSSGKSGILTLDLPRQAGLPPLRVGQDYRWSFAIRCQTNERSQDIVVEGWVRRVELGSQLQTDLEQASPERQVELYAQAEIWHDALATLIELRRDKPSDSAVADKWIRLLSAAGLSDVIKQSLISNSESSENPVSSSPF